MFRKIGNPKSALRNNCVGHRHGRGYGPYYPKWAVVLARFDGTKNLQNSHSQDTFKTEGNTNRLPHHEPLSLPFGLPLISLNFKTGGGNGTFSSTWPVVLSVFLYLGSKNSSQKPTKYSLWISQYATHNGMLSSIRHVVPFVILCLELIQNPTKFYPRDLLPRRGKRTVLLRTALGPFRFALA